MYTRLSSSLLFCIGIFLFGCIKETLPKIDQVQPEAVSLSIDGAKFEYDEASIVHNQLYNLLTISVGKGLVTGGVANEFFMLRVLYPEKVGKADYIISVDIWKVDKGNVLMDSYDLDRTYDNKLTIKSLDPFKKEIEGNFEVRLKRDPAFKGTQTTRIISGSFKKIFAVSHENRVILKEDLKDDTTRLVMDDKFAMLMNGHYFRHDRTAINYYAQYGEMYISSIIAPPPYGDPLTDFSIKMPFPPVLGNTALQDVELERILGGDVILAHYNLDETYNNRLTVLTYDPNKKSISGTFDLQLIRPNPNLEGSSKLNMVGRFNNVITTR